jgi:LysR family transcriptional regulator of beta-lactamase
VDLAGEGLDFAIRYGNGSWRNTDAVHLFPAPLSPVCAPQIAERISKPADLAEEALLRSYQADEWGRWFAAAGVASPAIKGTMFDSSVTMAEAAAQGAGVALLPVAMFEGNCRSAAWSSRSTPRYRLAVIGSPRSNRRRRRTPCGRSVHGSSRLRKCKMLR